MSIVRKIKRAVRGEVNPRTAALEALRRSRVAITRRNERAQLQDSNQQPARLRARFVAMGLPELLAHFRSRSQPVFLPGFSFAPDVEPIGPSELMAAADQIVNHTWSIFGSAPHNFGDPIDWQREPFSGKNWPLDYHADLSLIRKDGSDVRVLWELNRLPQLLTLARAWGISKDQRYAAEFLDQIESWQLQNPYGLGANWSCAMEVALRSMNLLGAFEIFRHSELLDESKLLGLLSVFDQHGTFIQRNLEFSYVVTSNHYLSDVVGLLWLGIMLPELVASADWREFGLREMLREMDKQILPDGADFESSTGYHRFVLELFLYTFILCRANAIKIEDRYWTILQRMLDYMRTYLRPDGRAPLLGDSDSGQVFPIRAHEADDHAYVLALGAVLFNDANLVPAGLAMPEEVPWIFGPRATSDYENLMSKGADIASVGFPNAGIYVLRKGDLSLIFNANDAGIGGRGSHGHNDALSIEVSACGVPFVVDPGTYVYTADLRERHAFRSTAYHSTIEIDGGEQNSTEIEWPFVIGNEAKPRVLLWEPGEMIDRVSAEHDGYRELSEPVTHRRSVTFQKQQRWWLVDDEFSGSGEHDFAARFHLSAGLEVSLASETDVWSEDKRNGAKLLIRSLDVTASPKFENQFTSKNYGSKEPSVTVCWHVRAGAPVRLRWLLVPVCRNQDESEIAIRIEQAQRYLANKQ